jgi:hypothetical protein
MEKCIAGKRGLLIILIIATVAVFVGLVWVITAYLPTESAASPSPSNTSDIRHVTMNCVAPVAYWARHPEYYPDQLVLGNKVYPAAEIGGIFSDQSEGMPASLQAQLTAAYLNILSGADQSYIQATIFEAYGWLIAHPSNSELLQGDQETGTRLFNLLEAFNLGETGVAPCDVLYLTQQAETSMVKSTSTETLTSTPAPSETAPASETPRPTETETFEPIYTAIFPTKTATRTTEAPIYRSPTPTLTLTLTKAPSATTAPSNTPRPPAPTTEVPTPPPSEGPTITPPPP